MRSDWWCFVYLFRARHFAFGAKKPKLSLVAMFNSVPSNRSPVLWFFQAAEALHLRVLPQVHEVAGYPAASLAEVPLVSPSGERDLPVSRLVRVRGRRQRQQGSSPCRSARITVSTPARPAAVAVLRIASLARFPSGRYLRLPYTPIIFIRLTIWPSQPWPGTWERARSFSGPEREILGFNLSTLKRLIWLRNPFALILTFLRHAWASRNTERVPGERRWMPPSRSRVLGTVYFCLLIGRSERFAETPLTALCSGSDETRLHPTKLWLLPVPKYVYNIMASPSVKLPAWLLELLDSKKKLCGAI